MLIDRSISRIRRSIVRVSLSCSKTERGISVNRQVATERIQDLLAVVLPQLDFLIQACLKISIARESPNLPTTMIQQKTTKMGANRLEKGVSGQHEENR